MSSRRWNERSSARGGCREGRARGGSRQTCTRSGIPKGRARGVALVTVIWLLALMTLLAGGALTVARTSSKLAANRLAIVTAELAADSALRRAVLSLLSPEPGGRWPTTGQSVVYAHAGETVSVRITDESGRIDINGADAALLAAAFAAHGVAVPQARALAARMIDWRDSDDDRTAAGAELQEYRARAVGYGPRNGPFESVDEMWLVLGMPHELRDELATVFTAFTGQPGVSAADASEDVSAVLRWADTHQWDGRRWIGESVAPTEEGRSTAGRVFRISAELVDGKSGAGLRREAVVRFTGNLRQPMLVYSWATVPASSAALESLQEPRT